MGLTNHVNARHGGMALKLALAVSWRLVVAAAPLNAAEQPALAQQLTPLETAQKFQSLTQGGLFDPNQMAPFESRRYSQSASESHRAGDFDSSLLSNPSLW
jgi:hypothetical protein